MRDAGIVLTAIEYTLGATRDIGEIPSLVRNPQALRYLKNLGIAGYSKIEVPVRDILRDTARKTLESSGVPAGDVGAVIFFSTMFNGYVEHMDLALIAHDLGLRNSLPFGMFLNQCTNYSQAFLFARFLIESEGCRHVLLLGADLLDDAKSDRVMPSNTSVYGDVAIGCMVSGPGNPGFRVGAIRHRYLPEMAYIMQGKDIVKFIENYSAGFKSACADMYAAAGCGPEAFDYLITANYNDSVLKNLAQLAGIPESKLFKGNVRSMGHCFSADHLISLKTLADAGSLRPGMRFNLVAVGGFWIFSSVYLEKA